MTLFSEPFSIFAESGALTKQPQKGKRKPAEAKDVAPPAAARFVPFFTQEHSRSSTLPRRSMFEPHGLRVAHLARPRPGTWSGFLPPITHRPERIANDTALVQLMKVMVRSAARQSPTSEVWFRQDRGAYVVDK